MQRIPNNFLKKFQLKFPLLISLNYILILFTNCVSIYITYLVGYNTKEDFVMIMMSEFFMWFVLNFIVAFLLYKWMQTRLAREIETNKQNSIINRFLRYTWIWVFLVGLYDSSVQNYFALTLTHQTSVTGVLIILLSIWYGLLILPAFLTYVILAYFHSIFTNSLYKEYGILFSTGTNKLQKEAFFAFLVTAVIPISIVLLEMLEVGYFDKLEGSNLFMFSLITQTVFGIVVTFLFLKVVITKPIHSLTGAFFDVQSGNYKVRLPSTSTNEIGKLTSGFNGMSIGLEERELIKDTFGKYLSPQIASYILKNPTKFEGEEKVVTILFSDIEGYTSISEKYTPAEVVSILNEYFTIMLGIISKNQGIVNKFIGDAVLAIFNAPLDDSQHAYHAIQAAREIIQKTEENVYKGGLKINTRIGINTGRVIVGNIGSKDRLEYTVIGDAVNITQRLEAYNKETKTNILIGNDTYELTNQHFDFKKIGDINVKGKQEKITVYTLR